ncbi:hypothetical protein NDN11_04940 [Acinetobacter sp. C26M]|uniref:hypothetical protein n=1 Tax=unclassified Acinetobacter TaxID=196816 RepID=UPI00203708D1|nr:MULTISPECIES: hypothetical protein [unclassified Acinetobacter]USA47464.1 hypothetical protein NDN11_04940 [Acinetobacter sp. C26M]USA50945.1 hypothetical protein NDN12_04940 [Acinetobacter sp. C26G]
MKKWICAECGLYKKSNSNSITIGQKVLFQKKEIYKRELFYKTQIGVVLKIEKDFFNILHEGRVFQLEKSKVYHRDAPAHFIYNMFGECKC